MEWRLSILIAMMTMMFAMLDLQGRLGLDYFSPFSVDDICNRDIVACEEDANVPPHQ